MAIYEIINVGANKALNIYGSDVKGEHFVRRPQHYSLDQFRVW